jgi:hypothetical protein
LEFDNSKIRGKIKEKYQSEKNFAEKIGFSKERLSKILNNETELKRSVIDIFIEKLEIQADEIDEYFFKKNVVNFNNKKRNEQNK